MTLHLLKLCVGIDSIEELARWQKKKRRKSAVGSYHYTRNFPKRDEEILDGGSMYWVIKGFVRVRQRIIALDTVHLQEEGRYCRITLHKKLVPTVPQPRKPHQGWRYLEPADAPPDLDPKGKGERAMPAELLAELKMLGLL
ncbi:MAG TPA: DUF1489 domain-containing protein [Candidatus Cybelea sp.]|nr:DUF1489 domain-containing protein [Candidatus Cybelea sp.]